MSSAVSDIQQQKKQLRREMRQKRRGLTPRQLGKAALELKRLVVPSREFRFSKHITFTLARDGEIDTSLVMQEALRRGKHCYLPVMSRFGEDKLSFRRWQPGQRLQKRKYGIPEPKLGKTRSARALSLVFLPLVAFDEHCNRVGMGKGYYDHTLAFLKQSARKKPALLGLAHECQRVEKLEVAPWDVPLEGIVTDKAWYKAPA